MASITTNGVVLEVPYAIIRNIQNVRPWTLAVTGRDPRAYAYNQKQLRSFPVKPQDAPGPIFVYVGDVITFDLQAPANATDALAFDLYSVSFTTGAETLAAQVGFTQVWQQHLKVTINTIHATTGALTFTPAWT
jgi:hypothetical protein